MTATSPQMQRGSRRELTCQVFANMFEKQAGNRATIMNSHEATKPRRGKEDSAILDRLLHCAEIIPITGRSYRLQESVRERGSKEAKSDAKEAK